MTKPAIIRKSDLKRYAEVATEKQCKIVIKNGDTTITVEPDYRTQEATGIDYSHPIL